MGLGDIANKAKGFLGNKKTQDAMKSEKAEGPSDKLLDGVSDAAKKVSGGKYDEKIDGARDAADKRIGDR